LGVAPRRRSSRRYPNHDRARYYCLGLSDPQLRRRRVGTRRAASAPYLDEMPFGRRASLVPVSSPIQRSDLWKTSCQALPRRRSLCVPGVLGLGLREPAGLRSYSWVGQGAENPNEIGRERQRNRAVSAQAEGYALENLPPTMPGSPGGRRSVVDGDDSGTRNATDPQSTRPGGTRVKGVAKA
jgi:hypothetical protein